MVSDAVCGAECPQGCTAVETGETLLQRCQKIGAVCGKQGEQQGSVCFVRILDRCNNISTMASAFRRDKLIAYIDETGTYVMALLDYAEYAISEYADAIFVVKYHVRSILETQKAMLPREDV